MILVSSKSETTLTTNKATNRLSSCFLDCYIGDTLNIKFTWPSQARSEDSKPSFLQSFLHIPGQNDYPTQPSVNPDYRPKRPNTTIDCHHLSCTYDSAVCIAHQTISRHFGISYNCSGFISLCWKKQTNKTTGLCLPCALEVCLKNGTWAVTY